MKINNLAKNLFLFILTGIFFGCLPQPSQETNVVIDDSGQQVVLKKPIQRIIALTPALTELLFVACYDSQIVAVTPHCNFPAAASNKQKIQVLPLDIESIITLQPDLVLTEQSMHSPDDIAKLRSLGINVYIVQLNTIQNILSAIRKVGTWCNNAPFAHHYADSLQQIVDSLQQINYNKRPRVVALIWQQPIYVYGKNSLMTEKIALAGGTNAIAIDTKNPAPEVSREYLLQLNPDIILGGNFQHLDTTFFRLYPELKRINAYQQQQIYPLDADLSSRPSPRVVSSVVEINHLIGK
jgi:iron complex transport system substrate-binding protein